MLEGHRKKRRLEDRFDPRDVDIPQHRRPDRGRPPTLVEGREERQALEMIPVIVRQKDRRRPRRLTELLSEADDARAGIEGGVVEVVGAAAVRVRGAAARLDELPRLRAPAQAFGVVHAALAVGDVAPDVQRPGGGRGVRLRRDGGAHSAAAGRLARPRLCSRGPHRQRRRRRVVHAQRAARLRSARDDDAFFERPEKRLRKSEAIQRGE